MQFPLFLFASEKSSNNFLFHANITKLTDTLSTLIDLVLSPGHSCTRALRRLKRIKIVAMLNNLI